MAAVVIGFEAWESTRHPWRNRELAEFYRIIDNFGQAGIAVEPDMGISDEGDPWFVLCRANSNEVIVHLTRSRDQYIAVRGDCGLIIGKTCSKSMPALARLTFVAARQGITGRNPRHPMTAAEGDASSMMLPPLEIGYVHRGPRASD